jgi:L-ascorbate 6-phosphate lactonase
VAIAPAHRRRIALYASAGAGQNPPMPTGTALIADIDACAVPEGACGLWWLGQQSFVAKLGDTVCYLDPYLSPSPHRQVPPLLAPEEVTNAQLILGSHDHTDHIDRAAWPRLAQASPQATFVVPELLRARLIEELGLPADRVVGLDDEQSVTVAGVRVTAVPAAHELLDQDPATGRYPYLGYVLESRGFCLYHAGDTCLYEGMQKKLRRFSLDLALLPINGRDAVRYAAHCIGNLTFQEAVDLAGAIRPGLTIPAHFDMFASNSEDPKRFVDYLHVKYPDLGTLVPQHGERVLVGAEDAPDA